MPPRQEVPATGFPGEEEGEIPLASLPKKVASRPSVARGHVDTIVFKCLTIFASVGLSRIGGVMEMSGGVPVPETLRPFFSSAAEVGVNWGGVDFRVGRGPAYTVGVLLAICAFCLIVFITTALDLFPSLFLHLKTQGDRSRFTVMEWFEGFGLSMFNLTVTTWFFSILFIWASEFLYGDQFHRWEDPWVWSTELLKVLASFVLVDVWFYATHRVLHLKGIYKLIHKLHHRFKAPTAVAAMYAHPLEYGIGNLGGVVLGIVLLNTHPATSYFWATFALMSTTCSHSGYAFMGAEAHDFHHQFFNYNFGVGGLTDAICGTGFEGSAQCAKWRAQQNQLEKSKVQ